MLLLLHRISRRLLSYRWQRLCSDRALQLESIIMFIKTRLRRTMTASVASAQRSFFPVFWTVFFLRRKKWNDTVGDKRSLPGVRCDSHMNLLSQTLMCYVNAKSGRFINLYFCSTHFSFLTWTTSIVTAVRESFAFIRLENEGWNGMEWRRSAAGKEKKNLPLGSLLLRATKRKPQAGHGGGAPREGESRARCDLKQSRGWRDNCW